MKRNVNALLHFKVLIKDQQESATVHLHHTQQKVQVQGRAAPWFVENVLKDIFDKEAKNKELSIREINHQASTVATGIQAESSSSVVSKSCSHCKKLFRSNTKLVSSCNNCCGSFHNSKTSPCFISHVCGGPSVTTPISSSSSYPSSASSCPIRSIVTYLPKSSENSSSNQNTTVDSRVLSSSASFSTNVTQSLSSTPTAIQRLSVLQEDTSIIELENTEPSQTVSNTDSYLDPDIPEFVPQASLPTPCTSTNAVQVQRFPNNSTRQRKSNVVTLNPEIEFQKASLDACRSTIIQQEAEIKRLKEALDLRNKRQSNGYS